MYWHLLRTGSPMIRDDRLLSDSLTAAANRGGIGLEDYCSLHLPPGLLAGYWNRYMFPLLLIGFALAKYSAIIFKVNEGASYTS